MTKAKIVEGTVKMTHTHTRPALFIHAFWLKNGVARTAWNAWLEPGQHAEHLTVTQKLLENTIELTANDVPGRKNMVRTATFRIVRW
jgi:hypothetical protein